MADRRPVQPATTLVAAGPISLSAKARWAVLGAVLLTVFLSSLDQTVVGTALPRIVTDLNGATLYTWVVTAYLLSSTATVPVYGKFSDVFGRKPMLLIGVSIFLAGSWLSGLSQNMAELVIFRGLQGLGAGAIFPISVAIIGDLFVARERGRYQGLFGAVFGISFLVGPLIGGWITDNISWHWVFYVNVPFGIAALIVLTAVLPGSVRRQASIRELDYPGIVLFAAGVVPLLLGLTNKGQSDATGHLYGWLTPRVGGLMLLGAVILVGFLLVEWRARQPILPLDLFKGRDYSASMAAVFFFGLALFTAVIFLPRFYQTVRGASATVSGYDVWPLLLGLVGGSAGSGQLISRLGRYKWLMVGATLSLVAGAFLMTHLRVGTPNWQLWLWMLVLGLGLGPSLAGFTVVVQNAVPRTRLGAATSTLIFLRQMGGSLGLALANTVFLSSFTSHLPTSLLSRGVPRASVAAISRLGAPLQGVGSAAPALQHALPASLQPLIPTIVVGIKDAFSVGVASLFEIAIVAGFIALLCTLILRDQPLRAAGEVPRKRVA